MKLCAACGKSVRKTSRAFVLGRGMSRVCADCLSYGLIVVGMRGVGMHGAAANPKAPRPGAELLAELDKKLRAFQQGAKISVAAGARAPFNQGRLEAYEGVRFLLKTILKSEDA